MTEANRLTRRCLLLVAVAACSLLAFLTIAPRADAVYGAFGSLGNEIKWGEEGLPGEVAAAGGQAHPYGFAADIKTGDFFIADEFYEEKKGCPGENECEYARIQEFDPAGKPIAEERVLLGAVKNKPPEIESLQLAVDSEKERIYMLVVDERPAMSGQLDTETPVATELYSFSTAAGKELKEEKLLVSQEGSSTQGAFLPLSGTKSSDKAPLFHPAGIAVDPETHDVVIVAQQEEGTKKEEEEFHTVVQRVHTEGAHAGELGPRYVDTENCLDEGEEFNAGEECAKGKGSEEFPTSPVVTAEGKLYVEEQGVSGEIWEVPAAKNEAEDFKTTESVKDVSSSPKRLYTQGAEEIPEGVFKRKQELEFASNEDQGGSMSFVQGASGEEGMFYLLAMISQGEGSKEEQRAGLALIEYKSGSEAKERGWTGAGPVAPVTDCSMTSATNDQLRIVGAPDEHALVVNTGTRGEEPSFFNFVEVLGFGPEGAGWKEACGQPTVTSPRVEVGEETNASQVNTGETVKVVSFVHGADALSTEWEFKDKTMNEVEKKVVTGIQHRQPGLNHVFQHTGEYEIVATVHTDCLGAASLVTTRTGLTVKAGKGPQITEDPEPKEVAEGATATFKASASGATSVQWQVKTADASEFVNDTTDPGNNTDTLEVEHVTAAESGNEYRAIFKDSSGKSESNAATLTVGEVEKAPEVVEQPKSEAVAEGGEATFTAKASGDPEPTIQWEVSTDGGAHFTEVSGAASETLKVTGVTAAENGYEYRAVFTNTVKGVKHEVDSDAATLTVGKPPAIETQPASATVVEGEEATFTAKGSGEKVTVQWEVSTNGGASFSALSGASAKEDTLKVADVTRSENRYEYRAVFSNGIPPNATSDAATLTVDFGPAIAKQPQSLTLVEGEEATFTAEASGEPKPTVQWEVSTNGGASFSQISGAASETLKRSDVNTAESGYEYRAVFTNTIKGVKHEADSSAAVLTVKPHEEVHLGTHSSEESKTSTTQTINPSPIIESPKGGDPEARLAGLSIIVTPSGALALKVTCPSGEPQCIGTVTLRTVSAVSASVGKGKKAASHKKAILTLASGSFDVAGGASEKVTLHLSMQGRKLLAHSHVLRTQATLTAHDATGATRTVSAVVELRLAKPATHRKG